MAFIGIIIESRRETELKQALKNKFNELNEKHTIIVINEKSIENVKNVMFEVIVLDTNVLSNNRFLKNVIMNSKRIIINSDYDENLDAIKNLKLTVITYGMKSKSTVTISSVQEDSMLMSIQRSIKTIKGNIIEPQEMKICHKNHQGNLYINMILAIFSIIFDKI